MIRYYEEEMTTYRGKGRIEEQKKEEKGDLLQSRQVIIREKGKNSEKIEIFLLAPLNIICIFAPSTHEERAIFGSLFIYLIAHK